MSSSLREVTSPGELRDIIEERRKNAAMSQRNLSIKGGVAHASYWVWLNSEPERVLLGTVFGYLKALGLRLFVGRGE